MISKHPHIIVIGAGITGASLAYHLARRQARVTLLDKAPKPANEATEQSFAWINVMPDAREYYMQLRQEAIADWHRVEDELNGQLKVDWSGAITWRESMAETEHTVRTLLRSGYPVRLLDEQEIRHLEPHLKDVPQGAMFAEREGAIDPTLTTELFVKAAREWGADIQLSNEVFSFLTNGSRVAGVVSAKGRIMADMIVLAAGVHTTTLCKPLGLQLPIDASPAILMRFQTAHRFVNRIVSNPWMEVRAASHTLTLAAEDYIDESEDNNPQAIAQRTLERIKKHWQGVEQIKLANVMTGKRPIPRDGLPIIGRTTGVDGLYISVMHSGVTLAAIAGRLAAADILSGQDDDVLLSPYRPRRFD